MVYQRTLKPGNLITIGKSEDVLLVVRSERVVSHDSLRGDSYSVSEIDVVDTGHGLHTPPRDGLRPLLDPEVKSFYFEGGSMRGKGKCIKDDDVRVVGTSNLTVEVVKTYKVEKLELYRGA